MNKPLEWAVCIANGKHTVHIHLYLTYHMYMYVESNHDLLHPVDEGQKPKTAVQGLHLLSFGILHVFF